MVRKSYEWIDGAILEDHSKRKHKIIREYFFDYLMVRCRLPYQERFRISVIDGFSGGGKYKCGSPGSPIIFVEELQKAITNVNINREQQGLPPIKIECLLILNDADTDVIELLKSNLKYAIENQKDNSTFLYIKSVFLNDLFENSFSTIQSILEAGRYRNVIFNLDQCGHSHVNKSTLLTIMRSYPHAEIFYTFMITSLLAFLNKEKIDQLKIQLGYLEPLDENLTLLEGAMSRRAWLGAAEKIVFDVFQNCAPFVSPFSINNPTGWRYWLIHFANVSRARQVYNNVLHDNSTLQAHYGRSGLNMLSYDPTDDSGFLYLFDFNSREAARTQLLDDIPRLVSESGDALFVGDFYESIYNQTAAHSEDIHFAMIESPDLEILTPTGRERRKPNTISSTDVIRLKTQRSFFPMFFKATETKDK